MQAKSFKISKRVYPSGTEYFEVTGSINGRHHKKKIEKTKGVASVIKPDTFKDLLEHLETFQDAHGKFIYHALIPYYAICGFAGVRSSDDEGEITQLEPKHIDLENDKINIPASISKVGITRETKIHSNLKAWLLKYPVNKFPVMPPDFRKLRRARPLFRSHYRSIVCR